MTSIPNQLQLKPLRDRRRENRLILFHKSINQLANLPTDQLRKRMRTTKTMHSQHFMRIPAKTDTFKYSFMQNTIKDWNSLSSAIINTTSAAKEPAKTFADLVKGPINQIDARAVN
ncbi:hypothetical protein ACJMK2_029542 [Sinanodonta woodiana]|uniref:Uncharacterized protein n=1 Tax=Sinanodonta woodiana TaxID=1069815 RepID=A0ABD3XAH2_SINWO